MDGALATVPVPPGPDDGLELTEEQTATLALLKQIRDQAGGACLLHNAGR